MMLTRRQQLPWTLLCFYCSNVLLLLPSSSDAFTGMVPVPTTFVVVTSTTHQPRRRILSYTTTSVIDNKRSCWPRIPPRVVKAMMAGDDEAVAAYSSVSSTSSSSHSSSVDSGALPQPPSVVAALNGKRVLPYSVLVSGLREQSKPVAAVYAVLNASYQRGSEGWEAVEYVGVTYDLYTTMQQCKARGAAATTTTTTTAENGEALAHVRALAFTFPQPDAMQELAQQWAELAREAGARRDGTNQWSTRTTSVDAANFLFDDDEDEDDDELEMLGAALATNSKIAAPSSAGPAGPAGTVVSPFQSGAVQESTGSPPTDVDGPRVMMELNLANVDKVLNEVRPYLIADGGNVAVDRVDEQARIVYLKLQGACGSCSSSTVTMQMGIERVLKENFPDLVQVLQVDDDPVATKPTQLTREAVEMEIRRLTPAVMAMGGSIELLQVDSETGVVTLKYRGANKVQKGLELAILDLPFANRVEFVMGE